MAKSRKKRRRKNQQKQASQGAGKSFDAPSHAEASSRVAARRSASALADCAVGVAEEEGSRDDSASDAMPAESPPSPEPEDSADAPAAATSRTTDEAEAADSPAPGEQNAGYRRLLIFASLLLAASLVLSLSGFAVGPGSSPEQRFRQFSSDVQRQLPGLMGGEADEFGPPTYNFRLRLEETGRKQEPYWAQITFEETEVVEGVGSITTNYTAKYLFGHDGWSCRDVSANIQYYLPMHVGRLSHTSPVRPRAATRLITTKRRAAHARLQPDMPLGNLLRSCGRY